MKTLFRFALAFMLLSTTQNVEAQLLKRLKDKITKKAERKAERELDKTIDNIGKPKPDTTQSDPEETIETEVATPTSGNAFLNHTKKYGSLNIKELGRAVAQINDDEVRIYGSWVTMSADIQDGYVLVIPNGQKLLFDGDEPKKEQFKLRIPQDAQLELSYDPVYDPNFEDENGNASAVTKDYQSYNIESGEVTIDVLSKDNFQLSFSGEVQLVTRTENPNKNSEDRYLLSYSPASVSGMVDVGPVNFVDIRTRSKKKSKSSDVPKISDSALQGDAPGVYQFTFETKVKVTNLEENETYNMSYLLNPSVDYIGLKTDMSEYSDEEMAGESIVVMDGDNVHIFVETQGMKMQMSQNMMGGQQQNPTDLMADYDYSNITKTGNTKTILGAICYEYVMAEKDVKMNIWVAPSISLPNWFIKNNEVIKGHIMEYTITSKDGNIKSETIAINDNISKTINPSGLS